MAVTHTLAVLATGGGLSAQGCSVCGATGEWRLRSACPWFMHVRIPQPERDDAFARAERYWEQQVGGTA